MRVRKILTGVLGHPLKAEIPMANNRDLAFKLTKNKDEAIALWTAYKKEHEITLPIGFGRGLCIDFLGNRTNLSWQADGLKFGI